MGKKEILDNACFRYSDIVSENVQTYFQHMTMHFFLHLAVYPDGRYWFLCTSHDWPKAIFAEKKIPPIGFTIYDQIKDRIFFPNMDKGEAFGWPDEISLESKECFGILHPMMITQKYEDHYEDYLFDLHSNNVCEEYVNCFEIFEIFIHHHKDVSKKIIQKVKENPLIVESKYLKIKNKIIDVVSHCDNICQMIQPKRYFLRHQLEDISVSANEYQCLRLLAHGLQIRSIAENMNVSTRTIETYFDRLKKKLNLQQREDIISVYWKSRLCPGSEL